MTVKVAHLTSHHNILDNRIFYRECRSLAHAGYEVILVAQHERDEIRDGIQVLGVRAYRNRLERVTLTAAKIVWRAWRERPSIIHLHDPELIPWGVLLSLLGKKVVYDMHEDFTQAAGVRPWLPGIVRPLAARFADIIGRIAYRTMTIVIAERYYARRFPDATVVLNYPHYDRSQALREIDRNVADRPDKIRLLYVGSITPSRGALLHAELAGRLPGCEVMMSGICDPAIVGEIRERSGDATLGFMAPDGRITWEKRSTKPDNEVSTLILEGVGYYVPPESMIDTFKQNWTAGIAIFPYTEHYYEKELTKFFEYMAAGLPVVLSNFPIWRKLVEEPGAGISADPANWEEIINAVRRLHDNPDDAIGMGLAGRRAVYERFNWKSQAQNLLHLYESLLDSSSSTSQPAS